MVLQGEPPSRISSRNLHFQISTDRYCISRASLSAMARSGFGCVERLIECGKPPVLPFLGLPQRSATSCSWAFLMPDTPATTARRQSGWGTPLPLPYPKQNCCNSTTASHPAASRALPHGIQLLQQAMPSPSREEPTVRTALACLARTDQYGKFVEDCTTRSGWPGRRSGFWP